MPRPTSRSPQQTARVRTDLKPKDITGAVKKVLKDVLLGSRGERTFLTAYQIVDRLPEKLRNRLIRERGRGGVRGEGGRDAGVAYAAPGVVSDAAQMLPDIEIDFIETRDLTLVVGTQEIIPGSTQTCALYRIPKRRRRQPASRNEPADS